MQFMILWFQIQPGVVYLVQWQKKVHEDEIIIKKVEYKDKKDDKWKIIIIMWLLYLFICNTLCSYCTYVSLNIKKG